MTAATENLGVRDKARPAKKAKQNGTTRARVKPLLRSNGKNRRTPYQLVRQERAFMLHIGGNSIRKIAAALCVAKGTIVADLYAEGRRRAEELGERREFELVRAIATYELILRKSCARSDAYDTLLQEFIDGKRNGLPSFNDTALKQALKARARIDRLLGLDVQQKTDERLDAFLDALTRKNEDSGKK